jgi:hypothetical protein
LCLGPSAGERLSAEGVAHAASPSPAAKLFVAPDGSDAGNCTRNAPCASFNRAFQLAKPGQIVEVAGGTYPSQRIWAAGRSEGPNVVFQPARGAKVVLGAGLELGEDNPGLGPDFLTIKNMQTAYKAGEPGAGNQYGIFIGPGTSNVRLEKLDAGNFHIWRADRITIKGGDYGPCHAVWAAPNVCGNAKIDVSTNITVDGAVFHDYRFDETCFGPGGDCHWECMYINAGRNVTIRNSKFRDCAIFDIFSTISGPDAGAMGHRNLTIENNWFDIPWDERPGGPTRSRAGAVVLAWCQNSPHGYRDVYVRFNSFQPNTRLEHDATVACVYDNVRVVGNLMMWDGCDPRYTYAYNVWSTTWRRGKCAPSDRIGAKTFPYVRRDSGSSFDFHLAAGRKTLADDFVPASVAGGCPRTDFDGDRRPLQKRCDAGADERAYSKRR